MPPDTRPPTRPRGVLLGLLLLVVLGAVAVAVRLYEFPALNVRWNENASAALVWTMLGLHLVYVAIEVAELFVRLVWVATYGLGENQAGDVLLSADYWCCAPRSPSVPPTDHLHFRRGRPAERLHLVESGPPASRAAARGTGECESATA